MTSLTHAFSGTLALGRFHYLLRTAMALAVAGPLGHTAGSQFDLLQALATLARPSVGWTIGSITLAGLLLAPWTHLAISDALAHQRSISAGFAMTFARYLDAVRIGLALLLIKALVLLVVLGLGLATHVVLKDAPDPRLHDLALLALGFTALAGLGCTIVWHDAASCRLVLMNQPWRMVLRTAAMQALQPGTFRPFAWWFLLGMLLMLGAAALGFARATTPAVVIIAQQILLFGYSVCRVARLKAVLGRALTDVDLNP